MENTKLFKRGLSTFRRHHWYLYFIGLGTGKLQIQREHDTITNFVTAEVSGNIGKNSRQCGTLAFKPERWLVK